jgi:alpha-1,3-rhamnosyl/mannosyltransferase
VIACLDGTPLTMSSGGLPRYVSELTQALIDGFPSDKFVLSSDQPFETALPRLPGPENVFERRWWLYGAERASVRSGATLFHGTNFAIPYFARRATVITIHDLSPWMDPEWHAGADRVRRRTPRMIGMATMIVTPTRAVSQAVVDRFPAARGKISVTHLAAAAHFRPARKILNRPYFLFVGTLEPRKGIGTLIEAWREVRRECNVDLVLAGRRRSDFPPSQPEEGLRILGETPEAALPELYTNALATVYASEYEGFGLPVLEAMQCGSPAIVSRDPALVEVSGGAAIQVSGVAELVAAMKTLFRHPEKRAEYSEQSLARAREFSWHETARKTYEVYQEAIGRFGR